MNKNDVEARTLAILRKHGINDWKVKWSRATSYAGITFFSEKTIKFSSRYAEYAGDHNVMNTIFHETAHVIVGYKHDHDEVWQQKFIELGGNGDRTTKREDIPNVYVWKGVCENGHEFFRSRRPKATFVCTVCRKTKKNHNVIISWTKNGVKQSV